ncbi:hypothetical protein [Salibacterium lacus]|uniref:DUF4760 domain-containing protein n=1 Tax=Salibacterium lacus TaxID=1898109 RepID=A0ABW5SXL1_9BACI
MNKTNEKLDVIIELLSKPPSIWYDLFIAFSGAFVGFASALLIQHWVIKRNRKERLQEFDKYYIGIESAVGSVDKRIETCISTKMKSDIDLHLAINSAQKLQRDLRNIPHEVIPHDIFQIRRKMLYDISGMLRHLEMFLEFIEAIIISEKIKIEELEELHERFVSNHQELKNKLKKIR